MMAYCAKRMRSGIGLKYPAPVHYNRGSNLEQARCLFKQRLPVQEYGPGHCVVLALPLFIGRYIHLYRESV